MIYNNFLLNTFELFKKYSYICTVKMIEGTESPLLLPILFMAIVDKITEFVEKNLENTSFFVVDVFLNTFRSSTRIAVFLDGDNGIGVEDCAKVSRALNEELEKGEIIKSEDYTLEVSSPGLDKPLKLKRQYNANIGRKLKIVLNDKSEKTGKLLEVKENEIEIMEEIKVKKKITEKPATILFSDINKANVTVVFN
jgi:ribosome maturation factor RimP